MNPGSSPADLVAGPDGNVWFTDGATKAIGRITPSNARGRALLKAGHGRLNARLTILRSSPSPAQTKAVNVTIVPQKTVKAKQPKK